MCRLCHVSGLAYFKKECFLNIHDIYGPWIALRAAVVFDLDGPEDEEKVELKDPCPEMSSTFQKLLEDAIEGGKTNNKENWRRWLALRDACPVGRQHRYYESQILYHYTLDKSVIHQLVQQDSYEWDTAEMNCDTTSSVVQ